MDVLQEYLKSGLILDFITKSPFWTNTHQSSKILHEVEVTKFSYLEKLGFTQAIMYLLSISSILCCVISYFPNDW